MADCLFKEILTEEFEPVEEFMEEMYTNAAGFIGLAQKGPVKGKPRLVTATAEFKEIYGDYLSEDEFGENCYLAYAVEQFFLNGGARCYIARVAPENMTYASVFLPDEEHAFLRLKASSGGAWGNKIHVTITPSSKAQTQIVHVTHMSGGARCLVENSRGFQPGDVVVYNEGSTQVYNRLWLKLENILIFEKPFNQECTEIQKQNLVSPPITLTVCEFTLELKYEGKVELYENLSFNTNSTNNIEDVLTDSNLVNACLLNMNQQEISDPFDVLAGNSTDQSVKQFLLSGGSDGEVDTIDAMKFIGEDQGSENSTGIQSFLYNNEASLMAIPGNTDPEVQLQLAAHCESMTNRFAVLDIPETAETINDILAHRNYLESPYAAMYHPWILCAVPFGSNEIAVPPSGAILGLYAKTAVEKGCDMLSANELSRSCVGVSGSYSRKEQNMLQSKGVNLIKLIQNKGIYAVGVRTLSDNHLWKYINISRLLIYIKRMILLNISWTLLEANNEHLWKKIRAIVSLFLEHMRKKGLLSGDSPEEAYFVDIGKTTMSPEEINRGIMICIIGVALVKPYKFEIIKIEQTQDNF